MIKWKQKNLSQVFAEPVTAVRQCAVNMKKKMGKGYLPLWTVPIKRCVNQGACEIFKEAHRLGSEEE